MLQSASAARPDLSSSGSQELELRVLEWIPDGVVVSDAHGTIVFANQSAEQLTGYRRAELVGRAIDVLVPERFRNVHRRHRSRYYNGQTGPRPMGGAEQDFMVRRKDGSEVAADIALRSINTDGRPLVVSVIIAGRS